MDKKYLDCGFEIKAVNDDGSFEGYGSVFGNVDFGGDVISKGAFADSIKSMKSNGTMPALLWQHKQSEPIGVYTEVREDETGLYVKGKLALKTVRGSEAYELMKMKALNGLSIGFVSQNDTVDYKTNVRTISKADLWEVSIVTFPMNDKARVSSVKSIDDIKNLADAENFLRESGGLSKSEATGLISRIKSIGRSDSDELDEVTMALKSLQSKLK
jgi:HK97 family phage prohead protease